jgi:hypothetical protein
MTSPAAKLHDAWATGPYGITSRDPLGCWARRYAKQRVVAVAREVIAGVGATMSARRRRRGGGARQVVRVPLPGAGACERACEDVRGGARA